MNPYRTSTRVDAPRRWGATRLAKLRVRWLRLVRPDWYALRLYARRVRRHERELIDYERQVVEHEAEIAAIEAQLEQLGMRARRPKPPAAPLHPWTPRVFKW